MTTASFAATDALPIDLAPYITPRPRPSVYARRRLAALLVLAAVLAVLSFAVRLVPATLGGVPSRAPEAVPGLSAADSSLVVVVQPGDTLWTIARRLAPGADPRALVDRLAAANGGAQLVVGQRIIVSG